MIGFQITAAGVSLAQVARRYAMNASLIFKWLRDACYALKPDAAAEEAEPIFLPVEVEAANSLLRALVPVSAGRIEIKIPGGWRVSAEGGFDADMLTRLLKGLSS